MTGKKMLMFQSKPNFYPQILVISLFVLMQISRSASDDSISTPCSTSLINTFTPCMNYVTGSSYNGTSPTVECCNSLKMIIVASIDCACLILTANVPLPTTGVINRALFISLPSFCNSPGVPVQCEASGTPLPPPGPIIFAPSEAPSVLSTRGVVEEQQGIASLQQVALPVNAIEPRKSIMSVASSGSSSLWTINCLPLMLLSLWVMLVLKLYR